MISDLSIKIIAELENIARYHKKDMNFVLRGEEAILIYLYKKEDCTVIPSQISECLNISTARVAASLNSLQSKELITRDINCNDRRKIIIKLTKKGAELAHNIENNYYQKINNILDKLSDEEKNQLYKVILKVKKILSEENSDVKIS